MTDVNKLLLVSPLPPPIGGISSWTVEVMNQLPDLGCEVRLVNSGIIGDRALNGKKVSITDEIKRALTIKKNIKSILKKEKASVIHYNASCFTMGLIRDFFILFSFARKAGIVYHCHCNLDTNVNNSFAKFFFKRICRISKRILALNENSLNFARRYTDNVLIIPNFIDKVYLDEANVREELKNIAFIGRVTEEKGIFELIEASKKLPEISFHIIGPDENDILSQYNAENIIYEGAMSHEKVLERLKEMDALVLPSYSEGFPLVVLEAMACALPIISTPVGSVPDMIGNEGGVLVELKSGDAIAEAVEKIRDKEIRLNMASYNLEKVKKEYLSKTVLNRLLEIYGEAGKC